MPSRVTAQYPCQESNLDFGVRSAALSPLSYKGVVNQRANAEKALATIWVCGMKKAALIGFPMGGSLVVMTWSQVTAGSQNRC